MDSSSTPVEAIASTTTTAFHRPVVTRIHYNSQIPGFQLVVGEPSDNVVQFPENGAFQVREVGSTGKGVLIGMLSAFGSALFIAIILALVYFLRYTSRGRILLDRIGRPGEYDDEQAFAKEEAEALEEMDDLQRAEYMRAKAFVAANPPESADTDISLSQFLAIQEKGVSAWEFEPELEIANCFVEGRTEIEFFDSECSVQSNLPVPKQNEVYYWEAKIYDKPDSTTVGIGMTTKPYPLFCMPGYHKTSVAYMSPGDRRFNQPFKPTSSYAPSYLRGDVIGCGYRPRSGTVFFTRNGRKLDDVTHTLKTQNLFPTIGANGPCSIHVNFGQMGFVFIEANVKKWGLAPMTGSLAPPPPYGSEAGSVLVESGHHGVPEGQGWLGASGGGSWGGMRGHARSRSAQVRLGQQPRSPGPQRSPTDISLTQLSLMDSQEDYDDPGEGTSMSPGIVAQESPVSSPSPSSVLPQEIASNQLLSHNDMGIDPPPPDYESPKSEDGGSLPHMPNSRRQRRPSADSDQSITPRAGSTHRTPSNNDDPFVEDTDEQSRLLPPPRSSSLGGRGRSDPPSPPIPSYDVAVGSASTGDAGRRDEEDQT